MQGQAIRPVALSPMQKRRRRLLRACWDFKRVLAVVSYVVLALLTRFPAPSKKSTTHRTTGLRTGEKVTKKKHRNVMFDPIERFSSSSIPLALWARLILVTPLLAVLLLKVKSGHPYDHLAFFNNSRLLHGWNKPMHAWRD
jgi:hypothetical protein